MIRSPFSIALLAGIACVAAVGCGPAKRQPVDPAEVYDGFRVRKVRSWPLAGPLPAGGPLVRDGELRIPIQGGWARFELPLDDAAPRIDPSVEFEVPPAESVRWAASPDGAFRAGIADGRLIWEKACKRCKRGFRRVWKTRLPANSAVPPIAGPLRVYAGALDNRIYAFKRRNGHRVWDAGLDTRIDRPMAWLAPSDTPPLLLAIIRRNQRALLLALNPATGGTVTKFEFPEGATAVGGPIALDQGRLAVAIQTYDRAEAALWLLQIGPKTPAGQSVGAVPYNGPSDRPPRPKAGSERALR